ncbi:hypothetical protein LIT25_26140 (plasmid) [Bacillus sp. F19]|nr:hypothetical protein LIT25_26140 [Bacillus sp. F19]
MGKIVHYPEEINKISILIVEDDTDISNMICDLLEQNEYGSKTAYSLGT